MLKQFSLEDREMSPNLRATIHENGLQLLCLKVE